MVSYDELVQGSGSGSFSDAAGSNQARGTSSNDGSDDEPSADTSDTSDGPGLTADDYSDEVTSRQSTPNYTTGQGDSGEPRNTLADIGDADPAGADVTISDRLDSDGNYVPVAPGLGPDATVDESLSQWASIAEGEAEVPENQTDGSLFDMPGFAEIFAGSGGGDQPVVVTGGEEDDGSGDMLMIGAIAMSAFGLIVALAGGDD